MLSEVEETDCMSFAKLKVCKYSILMLYQIKIITAANKQSKVKDIFFESNEIPCFSFLLEI